MLLPIKSKNPPESFPIGTLLLILANTLAFALTQNGLSIRPQVAHDWGVSFNNLSISTLFSSMFLHGDIFHLLGNMWFLYLFGFAVEGRLRTFKFLIVYVVAGLAGSISQVLIWGPMAPDTPGIGASGAIMGVLGAALYMFPFGQVNFVYWFWYSYGVFTAAMWAVGLIYIGENVLMALLVGTKANVGYLAHIGGAAGGFVAAMAFRPKRDSNVASEAKATLSETKDLAVLASYELAAMAASNPNDSLLILNWMDRSIREARVSPECHASFMKMLPQILAREDMRSVGFVLAAMSTGPSVIPPSVLIEAATRLERLYEHSLALRLYEAALRDPCCTAVDRESALFRTARLCEEALNNPQRAAHAYRELIRLYPMSPFATHAQTRAQVLSGLEH